MMYLKKLNLLLEKWELERTYRDDNGKKKVYKFYKQIQHLNLGFRDPLLLFCWH